MSGNFRRLFVGNLPWTISKRELRDYFSQFGYVSNAQVLFNKETGLSKGFGFVHFGTREGCINASNKENHVLEGNVIHVNPANFGANNSSYPRE